MFREAVFSGGGVSCTSAKMLFAGFASKNIIYI